MSYNKSTDINVFPKEKNMNAARWSLVSMSQPCFYMVLSNWEYDSLAILVRT